MLTPEERTRIEEEERKRIAEEQYRLEVRSKLEGKTERGGPSLWLLGVGAAVLVGVVALIWGSNKPKAADNAPVAASAPGSTEPVQKTRYVPVNQKIATGQIVVKAGGYVQYRITITSEMVDPIVMGSFNASGGGGNDIEGIIADESNFTNWINGHQAQALWNTGGKMTTGNLQVKLPPGAYYLVFSNKFSAFTDKQVFLEVELNYSRAETYYE